MGIQAPASVKFAIIAETIKSDNNLLCIAELCQIAGVSRSGYYNWVACAKTREQREAADRADFELIQNAYNYRGYAKGARGIHMRLLREKTRMNLKKIRRLMKKYGLSCPVRRKNPYRQMMRAMQTSHVAPNVVAREFRQGIPGRVLLTDITYLFYGKEKCYLSTILDASTHEILSYRLSESLQVDFVLKTVEDLITNHGYILDNETIVHSDQGCHYTSLAFVAKLKDASFVQSMSRKGNCWDNAPQESFFGHMKDEIMPMLSRCTTFEQVQARIDDWMDYYNYDRYQWDLLKLSPVEYRQYLLTGADPLEEYRKK